MYPSNAQGGIYPRRRDQSGRLTPHQPAWKVSCKLEQTPYARRSLTHRIQHLREAVECFCAVANHLTLDYTNALKILRQCESKLF